MVLRNTDCQILPVNGRLGSCLVFIFRKAEAQGCHHSHGHCAADDRLMAAIDKIPDLYKAIVPSSSQTSYMAWHSVMSNMTPVVLVRLSKLDIIFQ